MCSDIEIKWKDLIDSLKSKSDNKVKKCFKKIDLVTKAGKNVMHVR